MQVEVRSAEPSAFWCMLHDIQGRLIHKIEIEKTANFSQKMDEIASQLDGKIFSIVKEGIIDKIKTGIRFFDHIDFHYNENESVFSCYECVCDGIDAIGKGVMREHDDQFGHTEYFLPDSDDSKLKDIIESDLSKLIPSQILDIRIADVVEKVNYVPIARGTFFSKFEAVHYIPSIRANQEIVFSFKDYPIFRTLMNKYDGFIFNIDIGPLNKKFLKKWLVQEFKIVTKIEDLTFNVIEGFGVSIKLNKDTSLFQVGFGVTQLLPIILQLTLLENSVFIIEEPEANLHPALQSKMADMFMEAIKKFNVQIIVETHSEYFIRKLQYLTAKEEIKTEDTQIYYFYPPNEIPEGENQIYPISILDDGSLSKNFGNGFFDEAGNLDLLLYQMTQSRKN